MTMCFHRDADAPERSNSHLGQEDVSELAQNGGERQSGLSRVSAERPLSSHPLTSCQRQRPLANYKISSICTLCMTQTFKSISKPLTGLRYTVPITFSSLALIIFLH